MWHENERLLGVEGNNVGGRDEREGRRKIKKKRYLKIPC